MAARFLNPRDKLICPECVDVFRIIRSPGGETFSLYHTSYGCSRDKESHVFKTTDYVISKKEGSLIYQLTRPVCRKCGVYYMSGVVKSCHLRVVFNHKPEYSGRQLLDTLTCRNTETMALVQFTFYL